MRSQNEILKKIDEIALTVRTKKHPMYVQYGTLIHKLSWKNAKSFLAPKDYTEKRKLKWEEKNCLDLEYVLNEIKELLDISAMCVQDKNYMGALGCVLTLLAQTWLLGEYKDSDLKYLYMEFAISSPEDCYNYFFKRVCEIYGQSWERLKIRYAGGSHLNLLNDIK